uniref:Uncharacterized protein n=1 Tax=Ciona savignyi TaxID=51511 RepID=H2ZEQ2_CIOSA
RKPRNYPPGFDGVPLLGCLPFLGPQPAKTIMEWSKTYGDVFYVKYATQNVVMINSLQAIKETMIKQGHIFSGRQHTFITKFTAGDAGLGFLDYGSVWRSQRRFGIITLHEFGVGRKCLGPQILEEAELMCAEMAKHGGQPFDCMKHITPAVTNVIGVLVFGKRFEYDDPKLLATLRLLFECGHKFPFALFYFAPFLRFIPPWKGKIDNVKKERAPMWNMITNAIEEHEATYNENSCRDFIDCFIAKMKEADDDPNDNDETASWWNKYQLFHYVKELFLGGTDTTATALRWALLLIHTNPEIAKKLKAEIDNNVTGRVKLDDMINLPYTQAVIQEVFRYRPVVNFGTMRKTSAVGTAAGYRIPKGTIVMPNIWSVHHDPVRWKNPEVFRPERHIDENGKFKKSDAVIPFNVGQRSCLGRQLAQTEIFIFLVRMMQKFDFK